jgi:hypothetical protein
MMPQSTRSFCELESFSQQISVEEIFRRDKDEVQ